MFKHINNVYFYHYSFVDLIISKYNLTMVAISILSLDIINYRIIGIFFRNIKQLMTMHVI